MKKTYQNPKMKVVKMNAVVLQSASPQSISFGEGTKSGSVACGRDAWFDEGEE